MCKELLRKVPEEFLTDGSGGFSHVLNNVMVFSHFSNWR